MKLSDIILENWKPEQHIFNGKTTQSPFEGTADNINDLFKAIDRLPDTIDYIEVPINTSVFKTSSDFQQIEPTPGFKKQVKSIIQDLIKQYEEKGENVEQFTIRSYKGQFSKDPSKDSYYVQLKTSRSKKFAADMGAGKYGSLD